MTGFNIGDRVEFGVRQYWTGKGHPGIPSYGGTIVEVADKSVFVVSKEFTSTSPLEFTLRKNGNWVRKGHQDDNFRGYSRVALRKHRKDLETAE